MILQNVGFATMLLGALAALGLDRAGYPVISWLGHPAWICVGALLGVLGGIAIGYGIVRLIASWSEAVPRAVALVDVDQGPARHG